MPDFPPCNPHCPWCRRDEPYEKQERKLDLALYEGSAHLVVKESKLVRSKCKRWIERVKGD